jgi:hypothetical protein
MAKERTGATVTEGDARKQMEYAAEREEERRDLLHQVEGINQDESEIVFADTSPRRPMAIIYAMLDGEPLVVTRKRARKLLERKLPDGRFMFTADIKKAPTYKKGDVKCFLHRDSPERELMDSLGLQGKFCPAGQLANAYAKYIHESGKHVKTWDIWQKHVSDQKERQAVERQDRQFEATMEQNAAILELARSNQGAPAEAAMPCPVDDCNYQGTAIQLRGHKVGAHK